MSVQDLDMVQVEEALEEAEFKSSFGVDAKVPAPTETGDTSRPQDDKEGDMKAPKQGSSDVKMPKTKVGMINAMVNAMANMNQKDLQAAYGNLSAAVASRPIDQQGGESSPVMQGNSKIKEMKYTREDIDITDDIRAMFEGTDLSEEFKDQASTLFEAAVVSKINESVELLATQAEVALQEQMDAVQNELAEKVDAYLDYVVEEWMEENKLAVERGVKSELVDDFLSGLRNLFAEHYIDIPEEKVDVVEELSDKVEQLTATLNDQIEKNISMKKSIEESTRAQVVARVSKNLSDNQADKLASLAEGVDYVSEYDFEAKLETIKGTYFGDKSISESTSFVGDDEPLDLIEETHVVTDPSMKAYLDSISRQVTKK
jgi:SHS2 domain-containing protein